MYDLNLPDLKTWRKQFGISQKRLADAADVSLATLRQVEVKGNKPHRKTLRKVRQAIDTIEKRPGARKIAASAPAAVQAVAGRKRGRPPKSESEKRPVGRPVGRPAAQPRITSAPAGVMQLNNIDLELINRVLALDTRDKLALLDQLMG